MRSNSSRNIFNMLCAFLRLTRLWGKRANSVASTTVKMFGSATAEHPCDAAGADAAASAEDAARAAGNHAHPVASAGPLPGAQKDLAAPPCGAASGAVSAGLAEAAPPCGAAGAWFGGFEPDEDDIRDAGMLGCAVRGG